MSIVQQLGRVHASIERSEKAKQFCDLARIVAMSRGDHALAQHAAEKSRLSPTIRRILSGRPAVYAVQPDAAAQHKAAVAAGTTADTGWALPLAEYDVLAGAFLESLKNFGAFDAMLPSMRRVPLRTRIGASTTGITAATVGQAQVKPISKLGLTGTQIDER